MAEVLPQADYKLRIFDQSGDFKYEITNFLPLSYSMRVNAPGVLVFSLSAEHDLTEESFDKWQVEVWRKPYGDDWSRDFVTLIRKDEWEYLATPKMHFVCPGILQMLAWKLILYPANTANRTLFTDADIETICNTLVKYNATSDGTVVDGRDRAASAGYPFSGLSVEADGAGANDYTGGFYCARNNLLPTLQKLAEMGGGDFDIVKTSTTAWQWRWYEGQLGTDRSTGAAKVTFALTQGNMAKPRVINDRIGVKTVALVAGAGLEDERETAVVTSDDYAASNDIERFVDARDVESGDTDGLDSRGDEALEELQAKEVFTFDVLQTETSQFGVHYFLGDKCEAINPKDETAVTVKIVGATITLSSDGKETVDVDVEEV